MRLPAPSPALALPILLCLVLTGCPSRPVIEPPPAEPVLTAEQQAEIARQARARRVLDLAIAHFEAGNYPEAEHMLMAPEVWQAAIATNLQALKYLAFTYCVSDRPRQCRQAFERAFQLDPAFDLALAEQSHPLWGEAFRAARQRGEP
jgi:Tfp pilus assembly protein PilF